MMTRRRLLSAMTALVGVPVALGATAEGTKLGGLAHELQTGKRYLVLVDGSLSCRSMEHLIECARKLKDQKGLDLTFMAAPPDEVRIYELEGD